MDRKFEDQIAKLAFGELSEAEAAEVRSMAGRNADSAKALESYEALRSDLRRLRDVPPDQLSKERLQNAILGQGLKPKPVRSAFPWVWAPATALVAFVALVLLKGPSVENPVETGKGSLVAGDVTRPSMDAISTPDPIAYGDFLNGMDKEILSNDVQRLVQETEEAERGAEAATIVAEPVAKKQPRVSPRRLNRPSTRQSERSAVAMTLSAPAPRVDREPLVIIQNQRDGNTGALAAVEVQQTQDVIVSS